MKYVFICSPYRPVGEDPETELRKNIDQAKRACRLAVSRGLIPLAPHLYFTQFLDDNDPQERKFGQQAGKEWMVCVSELWVVGDRISSGMEEELKLARLWSIPIKKVKFHNEQEKLYPDRNTVEQLRKTGLYPLHNLILRSDKFMNMNAVGIDVSKGKSMVAILRSYGEIISKPFEVKHTVSGIRSLIEQIQSIDGESRIVMEHTGRYYEPLVRELSKADLFVSAINPKLIKDFGDNSLRKVKSDKADAVKIARYTLDSWTELRQYSLMDEIRNQLKTMNRQFDFYMKHKTAMKNNLISILDQTYPGANTYFDSPAREDGSQKWVDFSATYWHVDCVRKLSLNAFIDHYQKWCKRRKYNFSRSKAVEIYEASKELVSILPKDDLTKLIIKQAVEQLNTASQTVEQLRTMMNEAASKLPEYPVVMAMKGVGKSLGPQLMAEIGDVSRFTHKGAITAFAGVDPGVNESGSYEQKSVPASKRGSSTLRKTLFQVMDVLIKTKPQDDPVYLFMDKKRAQGKPYYVYMTAGANKFLRIYYGRVKEYLSSLPE